VSSPQQLAQEYSDDLKPLKAIYSFLKDRRDNSIQCVKECEESGEWDLSEEFRADYIEYRQRCRDIGGIISSSQFSIKWLKQGFEPRTGGVLINGYSNKKTVRVPDVDQALVYLNTFKSEYKKMSEEDKLQLKDRLGNLTPRERDVFISVRGQANSYEQTAAFLGISKNSVRSYLKRAEEKIQKGLEQGLQTSLF